jgi:NADH-quinone oxidoreductase subunit J
MIADILFYVFASVLLAAAVGVVTARNPMYCVLFMILAFFNAAGLFIMLGAEFLGLLLVMVYVGAIAVMFLFVVMTVNVEIAKERDGFVKNLPIAGGIGIILLAEFIFVLGLDYSVALRQQGLPYQ